MNIPAVKMKEVRKQRNKSKKLEEVQKPRGYERGLIIQKIVGCTDCNGELMFLVKWHDCDELDIIPSSEVNENDANFVIDFYEARCPLNATATERKLLGFPMGSPIVMYKSQISLGNDTNQVAEIQVSINMGEEEVVAPEPADQVAAADDSIPTEVLEEERLEEEEQVVHDQTQAEIEVPMETDEAQPDDPSVVRYSYEVAPTEPNIQQASMPIFD